MSPLYTNFHDLTMQAAIGLTSSFSTNYNSGPFIQKKMDSWAFPSRYIYISIVLNEYRILILLSELLTLIFEQS